MIHPIPGGRFSSTFTPPRRTFFLGNPEKCFNPPHPRFCKIDENLIAKTPPEIPQKIR